MAIQGLLARFSTNVRAIDRPAFVVSFCGMLWALLRYLDPIAHRQREESLRRQREDWPPDVYPDNLDEVAPPEVPIAQRKQCRICGHHGGEPRFCPVCLAETMQ